MFSGRDSHYWSDIYVAYQVAKTGTLSGAAAVLNVHHSTVLRRIDALEQVLNTRLFHRHARGYTVTAAGQRLLKVAESTEEAIERMAGEIAGIDEQLTGTVIVTTVDTLVPHLTPVFAEFQRVHPEIRVELNVDPRIFRLEYGEAHVSIRPGTEPKDPDYVVQHLRTLSATLYASETYIKNVGRLKSLQDLQGHRFISATQPRLQIPFVAWIEKEVPPEQIYYRCSDFRSMCYGAVAGLGIIAVNQWLASLYPTLIPLLASPPQWASDLWLVTHRDMHRTAKVQALTQLIKQHLGKSQN